MPLPEAERLLGLLVDRAWTLAVAESLTGGHVCATLVDVPGASRAVRGAVVAYDTDVKRTVLGVDAELLAEHGAVHPDVAAQMADGVRRALATSAGPASVGIATTGVAGPDPQDGQAVGTVFVAAVTPEREEVRALALHGDRAAIRSAATHAAIALAVELVGSGGS